MLPRRYVFLGCTRKVETMLSCGVGYCVVDLGTNVVTTSLGLQLETEGEPKRPEVADDVLQSLASLEAGQWCIEYVVHVRVASGKILEANQVSLQLWNMGSTHIIRLNNNGIRRLDRRHFDLFIRVGP